MRRSVIILITILLAVTHAHAIPSFEEVKKTYRKSDALLLDRHGEVIHELRVDPKGRRLQWTPLKDISPALVRAVLHSEDRRFYEHGGVDWKAAGTAAIKNLFTGSRRGASTISMQLAAMLDKGLRPKAKKRDLGQKWDQMQAARELEKSWAKSDILEAYLNLVTYRGELQGITASSEALFGKSPAGLDEQESVLLASLIRSPNATHNAVAERACLLASSMDSAQKCSELKLLSEKKLTGPYEVRQKVALAPHVARMLLKNGRLSASSTLDAGLQRFASDVLKYHISAVIGQNVRDGAVLVADNRTGEILAYVANSGDISTGRHVDGITARRQAGSTLKPFLYGIAFDRHLLTPASMVMDSPLDITSGRGIYRPDNYDNDFKGPVPARVALASSLNVPAVRTLSLVGKGAFVRKLGELGIKELQPEEHYGYSIALGTADVTLYELVNAYRTLANRGVWSELRMEPSGKGRKSHRIYSEEAAYLVSDILSDREARSVTFGFENPLSTKFWTAVKTGTSKDMRDNWCIGYTEKYTVGVWVGNFSGEPMWNVSGVTGAAPVWHEVMNYLHAGKKSGPPKMPKGMVVQQAGTDNSDQSHAGLFIKGTEPIAVSPEYVEHAVIASAGPVKITYPADGMIIAIDPDIPDDLQRVFFESSRADMNVTWQLNSEALGRTSDAVSWRPEPGKYALSLADKDGRKIDTVRFVVRGNRI